MRSVRPPRPPRAEGGMEGGRRAPREEQGLHGNGHSGGGRLLFSPVAETASGVPVTVTTASSGGSRDEKRLGKRAPAEVSEGARSGARDGPLEELRRRGFTHAVCASGVPRRALWAELGLDAVSSEGREVGGGARRGGDVVPQGGGGGGGGSGGEGTEGMLSVEIVGEEWLVSCLREEVSIWEGSGGGGGQV